MGAKANRTYVASVKEAAWGVTPAAPTMQKINFTGESLKNEIASEKPNTIRDDRMVSDLILTGAGNTGGYDYEMQFGASGADDPHFLAALWADEWIGVDGASATLDVAGGGITDGTTLDLTLGTGNGSMVVGQTFALSGSGSNDGLYTVATAAAPIYTITGTFPAVETFPASTVISGQMAINGLTRNSFTLERGHADVGEFFVFSGQTVDTLTLALASESVITGAYTFIGKKTEVNAAAIGTTYTDASNTTFMSASFSVAEIKINDLPAAACLVDSMELVFGNNLTGKTAVAVFGYCDVSEGEFDLTGSLSLNFLDSTMYKKFIANTAFSISFVMYDTSGNGYHVAVNRAKISEEEINATGKNTDVMDEISFQATRDAVTSSMVIVTRVTGYTPPTV